MKKSIFIIIILFACAYSIGILYFDRYTTMYKREETRYLIAESIVGAIYTEKESPFYYPDIVYIEREKTKYQRMLDVIPVPFSMKNELIYSHKLIINQDVINSNKFYEIKYYICNIRYYIDRNDNKRAMRLYNEMHKCKKDEECYVDIYTVDDKNDCKNETFKTCKHFKFIDRIYITF